MAMTAEELLNKLEQGDLVPPEIVASLRRQVAAAKDPIAPAAITKLLVDKGHLTANQSQRLLGNPAPSNIGSKSQVQGGATKATASSIQKEAAGPPSATKAAQPKGAAPSASLSSSSIHGDELTPLEEVGMGPTSSISAASSIHSSGIHSNTSANSASLSGSNVLDDSGLKSRGELTMDSSSSRSSKGATPARAASLSGSNVLSDAGPAAKASSSSLDDLALAPDDGLSHKGPPPGSLAAKVLEEKAAAVKQAAAESGSVINRNPEPVEIKPKPKPKSAAPVAPVVVEDLPPLDDLAALDLDALTDLPSLDAPSPLGDPLAPGPVGPGPLGPDPLSGPADLGALSAQTATPLGQPSPQALAAATAANESRTTMLVGGLMGGAALLVIIVGLAVYFWPRGSGMVEFQAAEQAYQEKQYPAALEQYAALLRQFPRHEQASLVRVHQGMCSIHLANPGSGDWSALLPTIRDAVTKMAAEAELPQVHAELAPLLIQQCEALTEGATKPKPGEDFATKLQEARAALALCNDARLVPSSLRPWQKLAAIEERLQLLSRDQDRAAALEKSRSILAQRVSAGDAAAFYQERSKLLASFPELATDGIWTEMGTALADLAVKKVKPSASKKPAAKEQPPAPWLKSVPWTHIAANLPQSAEAQGRISIMSAGGTVYGVDAATGGVRWSRYAGLIVGDAPVVSAEGSSVFLVDRARNEFVALQAASGNWLWSQPLAAPAAAGPVLGGNRLYVTITTGAIQAFDAISGELLASAELPQPASGAAALSPDGKQLLQVGEEGLAYVLSAETLQAERSIYLGHQRGGVRFAPVLMGSLVVVAARRGESTDLHALNFGSAKSEAQRLTSDGAIGSAMVVSGQRLVLATEGGKLHVLELGGDSDPLRLASSVEPPAGRALVRHLSAIPGGVCAADQGCTVLKFNSQGKLEPALSALPGETCDAPAVLSGETLLATHYNAPQGIVWVSAVNTSDGQVQWQLPVSCALEFVAGSDAGAPAVLPWQNLPADFLGTITTGVRPRSNFAATWLTKDQLLLCERGRPELLLYERPASGETWQSKSLSLPGAALAGLPALVGQHLLTPLSDGSMQCLNAQTGEPMASPFVLPGGAGAQPLPPAVLPIGDDGKEALVFDGGRSLVRISRAEQPQPHWAEQATVRVNEPLAAPPVLLESTIFAVDRQGIVQTFELPDLTAGQTHNLRGAVAHWGPHRCGECVLLATDGDELLCLDAARVPRWQQPLAQGPLTGPPLAHQNSVILLGRSGLVEVRSLLSGDVIGSVDLKQPLAGPALIAGNTLWVATSSGQAMQLTIPAGKESP
jgi:outer membrane protein assembly factor BamB